jgi:hypothetical protein
MTAKQLARRTLAATLFIALGSTAWSRKFTLTPSNRAPAASGFVSVKNSKSGNREVDITVRKLTEAKRLDPPANTYVVWLQHQDSPPENAGELKVGENGNADLKTRTTWRNFSVFVTAETDPHVLEPPLGPTVLQASINLP